MIKRALFFDNQAYLSLKNRQLVVNYPEDEKTIKTVPVEDIGIVVIESLYVTVSSALSNALVKEGVSIIYCDEKHMPSGLLLPFEGHSQQTERIRIQMDASLPLKKNLWQQTVIAKITNQAYLLANLGVEISNMLHWAQEVKTGDVKNHEAKAAIYYWSRIFTTIKFTRDPDGDPPNNLLNYGYAILRSITARAIVSSGMLPMLGIFHKNKYNAFGLADDIMEPYRPFLDQIVIDIIESGAYIDELTKDHKVSLLGIMRKDVIIDGEKSPLMVAMSRTTSSLFDCYQGKARKILYPSHVESIRK
jgi:CRISPR-associated protein Cas1